MGKAKDDGGPAFPSSGIKTPRGYTEAPGISLRDYIASHVNTTGWEVDGDEASEWLGIDPPAGEDWASLADFSIRVQAAIRYKLADAMLKARES